MSQHPTTVEGFDGSLEDLAKAVGNLRYDSLAEFLAHLSVDLRRQSIDDGKKGRSQLSTQLGFVSVELGDVATTVGRVWDLCRPHMER